MIHKEFWGILFLLFVGWIFVPSYPEERIQHACRPVGWTGNVVTSLTSLVMPTQQENSQYWFAKVEYGCQYTVWRLIYQEDYNKQQAGGAAKPTVEKSGEAQKEGARKAPAPPEAPAKKASS